DGVPVWHEPALLADEEKDHECTALHALTFIRALASRLGVATELALPGYEDAFYYLWKERQVPVDVDPLRADLKDPLERQRLADLLMRGLGTITGYALPLKWSAYSASAGAWRTARWVFRHDRMYLVPGHSPMGYRLPLDSLPWMAAEHREMPVER